MNKKILGIFVSLLAVGMVTLQMSVAFANKPLRITLRGTYMLNVASGLCVWTGDIEGDGVYYGVYNSIAEAGRGTFILEDATIDVESFLGSGDLTIVAVLPSGQSEAMLIITSGTDDLKSIRGRGTDKMVTSSEFEYTLEIKINL